MLPALAASDAPVLLGDSSHHLPATVLRELGGWDPFHGTAEADLGVRLARAGHHTAVLDSATWSSAPGRLGTWLRECSRSTTGLLLTGLVQLRHPARVASQLGGRAASSLALSLAGVVVLLLQPVLWATVVVWLATRSADPGVPLGPVPELVGLLTLAVLVLGNAGFGFVLLAGGLRRGEHLTAAGALLAPLCAALLTLAAWRGLAQLVTQPFRWERSEPRREVLT